MADKTVEWCNVQGLVLSGLKSLRCAAYVLFRFEDRERLKLKQPEVSDLQEPSRLSREWLWRLTQRITNADEGDGKRGAKWSPGAPVYAHSLGMLHAMTKTRPPRPEAWVVNVAFTPTGLALLGAKAEELDRFADEFQKGMAPTPISDGQDRRSSLLGDAGSSSPEYWSWGGWSKNREFDGVLLLYAANVASLNRLVTAELGAMKGVAAPVWCRYQAGGAPVVPQGRLLPDNLGHFGFVDGISQPLIAGTRAARGATARERRLHEVPAGEFVLGYDNMRGAAVSYGHPQKPGSRDLARNGTYLVARQLDQNALAYEAFLAASATAVFGRSGAAEQAWVGSKLMGRRQDGEALVSAPLHYKPGDKERNDFLYALEDGNGLACPMGAHIRRANPRDLIGPDPETALRLSKMHRIMRRGRPYGLLRRGAATTSEAEERGIFFLCLNASIAGQFELIQHTWINNPAFGDVDEVDAFSHVAGGAATIQARPSNIRLQGRKPFVTVRGGAYFFMPGLNALRQLSA